MKKNIITLIFFMSLIIINAADFTTELNLHNSYTEKAGNQSEVKGKVLFNFEGEKNYTLDGEYSFGDNINKIDMAKIKFDFDKFVLEIGRNRIGWGVGYNFNPIDIFNSKPIGAAFDTNYLKDGRDSIIMTYYNNENSNLQAIYAIKKDNSMENDEVGIKYKTFIKDFSVEGVIIKKSKDISEKKDLILGGTIAGSIPKLDYGIWSESAYYTDQSKMKMVVGMDNYFDKLYVNIEYYYNGFGENKKEMYTYILAAYGKNLAHHYFVPSLKYDLNEQTSLSGFDFLNLDDYSNILGGVLNYLYDDNIGISISPYLLIGEDDTEYGMAKSEVGSYGIDFNMKITF
ncbi:hypothetical protein [Haliovirga abyssi]|uniref:Porin n=1 Tax=Haliovirga abyssi TaxID=2996794 RepID=A0AAU9DW50_9FUSO|nr:hypothetical protein [Haliovirga abyssi]BDU51609.1 hypothetical protein HLVA_21780 [Haliovirga abyssi]